MVLSKDIISLRLVVENDIHTLASFIDPKKAAHKDCDEYIEGILEVFKLLIVGEEMEDAKIKANYYYIKNMVDTFAHKCKDLILLYNFRKYIKDCLDMYIGIAISYDTSDGYYTAYNLSELKKIFII